MSASHQVPWTQTEFLDWAEAQSGRHEFDGFSPVAMTGGTAWHNQVAQNLYAALRQRLRGTPCWFFGPDLGINTVGEAIRFPDALITCAKFPGEARIAPDPVVVFEVLSPSSGRIDRIVKLREYQAVASIRRYAIIESTGVGVTVLEKLDGAWKAEVLTCGDTLRLPEAGIELPVAGLYEGIAFPDGEAAA